MEEEDDRDIVLGLRKPFVYLSVVWHDESPIWYIKLKRLIHQPTISILFFIGLLILLFLN